MKYLKSVAALALATASAWIAPASAQDDSIDDEMQVVDGQAEGSGVDDLIDLSLEELLAQEVTSVAKKSRRLADSAAAITVISQEDIRRSPARTIPDLLRMVPGMEVSEIQSSATSVSARGFTSRYSNNLLVMVDGASIYSTSISGMFWDQALVPLQDIERIEVIRGPGGTLWGSNSVNGIVNIITKQSVDTQGLRINGSVGTFDRRAEVGYGQQLAEDLSFRVYGDYRQHNGLDVSTGSLDGNSWEGGLGGVRFDYAPTDNDTMVFLAEHSRGSFDENFINVNIPPFPNATETEIQNNHFETSHLLARWNRSVSSEFEFSLQAYYNSLTRTEFEATVERDLYDFSAEGRWRASNMHEFNFGVGARFSDDRIAGAMTIVLPGEKNSDRWLTAYLQDEVTLIPDKLRVTLGTKFEDNNFTGTEWQPSARVFYRFNEKLAAWASVSRALRMPLLGQRETLSNLRFFESVPGFATPVPIDALFVGNPNLKPETLTAYEFGLRGQLAENWSFELALHKSDFDNLITYRAAAQSPILVPPIPFPVGVQLTNVYSNAARAVGKGGEFLISGRLTDWWSSEASFSYLDLEAESDPGESILLSSGSSPRFQTRLKSRMDLTQSLTFDTEVHWVGKSQNKRMDGYVDLDIRAGYQLTPNLSLALVGSNLLDKRRLEFAAAPLPLPDVYVPRSGYVELSARF